MLYFLILYRFFILYSILLRLSMGSTEHSTLYTIIPFVLKFISLSLKAMEPMVREWRLVTYRCFHESEAECSSTSTDCPAADKTSAKTKVSPSGVWLTRHDHAAAGLLLRLSDYGHLAVMQGSEVVESLFPILARKWIKAVNIG